MTLDGFKVTNVQSIDLGPGQEINNSVLISLDSRFENEEIFTRIVLPQAQTTGTRKKKYVVIR